MSAQSFLSVLVLVLLLAALVFAGAWLQQGLLQTFAQAQAGLRTETVGPRSLYLAQVIVAFETRRTQLQNRNLLADLGSLLGLEQPQQWWGR